MWDKLIAAATLEELPFSEYGKNMSRDWMCNANTEKYKGAIEQNSFIQLLIK